MKREKVKTSPENVAHSSTQFDRKVRSLRFYTGFLGFYTSGVVMRTLRMDVLHLQVEVSTLRMDVLHLR